MRASEFSREDRTVFEEFKQALNRGEVRAAEKNADGKWLVNSWVKQGLLLGFRMGATVRCVHRREALNSSIKILIPAVLQRLKTTFVSFPVVRRSEMVLTLRRVSFVCRRCL